MLKRSELAAQTLKALVQAMMSKMTVNRARMPQSNTGREWRKYISFRLESMDNYKAAIAPAVRNILFKQGVDLSSDFGLEVQNQVQDLYKNMISWAQDAADADLNKYFKWRGTKGSDVRMGDPTNFPMVETGPDRSFNRDYERSQPGYAGADHLSFQHPVAAAKEITKYLNGRIRERQDAQKVIDKNLEISNLVGLAQQKLAAKIGMMRFLGLIDIGQSLLKYQDLHVGTLGMKDIFRIQSNIGEAGRLAAVFAGISVNDFLVDSGLNVASGHNPRSKKQSKLYPRKKSSAAQKKAARDLLQKEEEISFPFVFFGDFLNLSLIHISEPTRPY